MSADKAQSRARRLELLHRARQAPILIGDASIDARDTDLQRLVRDGHLKEIRVPKGERATKGFEITPRGELFRLNSMDPRDRQREERGRVDSISTYHMRGNYRDLVGEREVARRNARSGFEGQQALSRWSAETAALITAALREAEAEPFVLDTGWVNEEEIAGHYLMKMLKRNRQPDDGFTLYDRRHAARTIQIKKRLDGKFQDTFDLMVVRSLGGGAVICHILSDELPAQQAEWDRLYADFCKRFEAALTSPEQQRIPHPIYPKFVPKHRLLLLSTGEAMNLYLQMAFR
jgi:hypothetical protein